MFRIYLSNSAFLLALSPIWARESNHVSIKPTPWLQQLTWLWSNVVCFDCRRACTSQVRRCEEHIPGPHSVGVTLLASVRSRLRLPEPPSWCEDLAYHVILTIFHMFVMHHTPIPGSVMHWEHSRLPQSESNRPHCSISYAQTKAGNSGDMGRHAKGGRCLTQATRCTHSYQAVYPTWPRERACWTSAGLPS